MLEAKEQRKPDYRYVVLLVCTLALLGCMGLGRFSYSLILPSMREGLLLSYTQAGMVSTATYVGALIASPFMGILASKYSSRLIVGTSMIVAGCAMVGTGISPSFQVAVLMQAVVGIGTCGGAVGAMGLAPVWFGPKRRGMAMGIINSGTGVGVLLASILVPGILSTYGTYGWRYGWGYLGVTMLFIGILASVFLRNKPDRNRAAPVSGGTHTGDIRPTVSSPQWRSIYRMRPVWYVCMIYFMWGLAISIYSTFFVTYLFKQSGISYATAASLWALCGAVSIGSGLWMGPVSDTLGRKYVLAVGYGLLGIGSLLLILGKPAACLYLAAILPGLAWQGVPAVVFATLADYTEAAVAPAAIGLAMLFSGFGLGIGPIVAGYVRDVTGTFVADFLMVSVVSFVGTIMWLFLRKAG